MGGQAGLQGPTARAEARAFTGAEAMNEFPPERLGGETDPNAWHFQRVGEEGPLPNPVGHTFPFLTHDADGQWRLVGTGFYVNDSGMFVTARHVIEEAWRDDRQVAPLVILHLHSETGLFGASEALLRPIQQCWVSDSADVAFGVAAARTDRVLRHWAWTLSWAQPPKGALVSTYAFPNHTVSEGGRRFRFAPSLYSGRVLAAADFRDRVMVPFPYLEVDLRIHGAASGGPIALPGGHVVGINCTEWPINLDHPAGPGFGAQTQCLEGAFLEEVVLPGESDARVVTLDELIAAKCIYTAGYSLPTTRRNRVGRIFRPEMLPTAAPPAIEVEAWV